MTESVQKESLVLAFLDSGSITAAAEAVGVSKSTAHRWLSEPEQRQLVIESRRALLSDVLSKLEGKLSRATDVLSEVADDPTSPASAKVSAANSLITHASALSEQLDLSYRLSAIEAALEAGPGHTSRVGGTVITP